LTHINKRGILFFLSLKTKFALRIEQSKLYGVKRACQQPGRRMIMRNRLEEIRKENKVRQGDLAKAMDVSRQTISSLENGRYSPSIALAFKLALYFNKTIEEIFIYEDEAITGLSSYLNYKGYVGSVEFDAKDKVFRGRIVGIKTPVLFEGKSVLTISEGFHAAIDEYLNECLEKGEEPEKAFRGSFNVHIDAELHRKVALEAAKRGITMNAYIEEIIASVV
jgi:predicted HicB family RNase H-like nuclease/DNA-binding transcriptional regulator YiaG